MAASKALMDSTLTFLHLPPPLNAPALLAPTRGFSSWKWCGGELSSKVCCGKALVGAAARSSFKSVSKDEDDGKVIGELKAKEDLNVVIVGAGIAGLATALALHRLGISALVLEQSDSLRGGGTSLTVWNNAWRALEALGVAEGLREKHDQVLGVIVLSQEGRTLQQFQFDECPGGPHDIRGLQRSILLEELAKPLPQNSIHFNSKVVSIKKPEGSPTVLQLENGRQFNAKVLVGCDGVNSVVGKWMGQPKPHYVGQIAIRGMANYTGGHKMERVIKQILGKGVRVGLVPVSSNKVYWFIVFNSSSPGLKISEPELIKQEALEIIRDWEKDIVHELSDAIEATPADSFIRSNLRDRWALPLVTPPLAVENITLAGDALHPITPNLGQGGCLALEDGVILARQIFNAMSSRGETQKAEPIGSEVSAALQEFVKQRWSRFFPLSVRSNFTGAMVMWDSALVCYARDAFGVKLGINPGRFLDHTLFDCGLLNASPEE